MHRSIFVILPILVLACQTTPVPCTGDEDCDDGTYCYLQPRGANDPEAPEGMEPHRAKYQDEGVCRQDCITDQDCHGAFRCTKDGVCLDLEQSVGARQYTPAYEPDPVSLREAFESDKLLNCREFIGCYIGCNGDSRTCRLECEVQTEPAARSQVGQILHCVQNICESPEASEIGYVDCLRGSCPAVLEACGIP